MMNDSVLARVAALKGMPTPELKLQWQQLFDAPPPPYNRRFLESRLAYRIQELAYGGLKPEIVKRLEAMGEQLDGGSPIIRRIRADEKPIAGTRLIREYQGVEQTVMALHQPQSFRSQAHRRRIHRAGRYRKGHRRPYGDSS